MIAINSVFHCFNHRKVLDNICLQLNEKRIAIIGANGSGKSTFLRLLNGLVIADEGDVVVDNMNTREDVLNVRKKVGFVFQNPDNQIVYPLVSEDIAFGLKNMGFDKKRINETVSELLADYGLTELSERYTHELSGGEKQMIAICGVLAMQPKFILFDEPTTLLDLRNKHQIENMIAKLPQHAIVVTHDLEWASQFERVICFDKGKVVFDGKAADVIANYKALMTST